MVVLHVHLQGDAHLPEMIQASHAMAFALGSRQTRQQQRGENGDDGEDGQHFDQGERPIEAGSIPPSSAACSAESRETIHFTPVFPTW